MANPSTLTQEDQEKAKAFVQPIVHIGSPVLWYLGGRATSDPYVGIVTRVGFRSVDLVFFAQGSEIVRPREGVRHISDPEIKDNERQNSGAWDLTEGGKQLAALFELASRPATNAVNAVRNFALSSANPDD